MEHRDRAVGWQHAKLSGRKNEELVKIRLDTDQEFQSRLLDRIGYPKSAIIKASIGGLHEKNVASVNHSTTKSKTDLKVFLNSGEQINISIKKARAVRFILSARIFLYRYLKRSFKNPFQTMQSAPSPCFGPPRTTL